MLGLGFALTNFGTKGGVVDTPDLSGSSAAALLAAYGGEGFSMIFDSAAPSLKITDSTTPSNDWDSAWGDGYSVQDFFKTRSFTSYTGPVSSGKRLMQADGYIKPCRHNLNRMSNRASSAAWSKQNASVVAKTAISVPSVGSGTTTDALRASGSAGVKPAMYQALTVPANIPFTLSAYCYAGTTPYVALNLWATGVNYAVAVFNLSAGSGSATETFVGATSGTIYATAITDAGGGWYRISMTASTSQTAVYSFYQIAEAATGNTVVNGQLSWTAAGTEDAYFWGMQTNNGYLIDYVSSEAHNLTLYSEQLDNAAWSELTVDAIAAGTVVAPDGTSTAETITATAGSNRHAVAKTSAITSIANIGTCVSIYVKAGTSNYCWIGLYGGGTDYATACFDLSDGLSTASETFVGTTGAITATAKTALANSWYRISISCSVAAASVYPQFGFAQAATGNTVISGGYISFNAAGTETQSYWGAQVELSSTPGKYVATTTTAVYNQHFDLPVEYNTDGTVKALTREEARTNLQVYSNIDVAHYSIVNITPTADSTDILDISGGNKSTKLVGANGSAQHLYYEGTGASFTSGSIYCASVFVKAGTLQYFQLLLDGSGFSAFPFANFDIQAGTATGTSAGCTAGIIDCKNGWYRVWITATCTATGPFATYMSLQASGAATYNAASDVDNLSAYVQGIQVEAVSSTTIGPSSYIVTGSAAVTRAADVIEFSNRVLGWSDATLSVYTKATLDSIAATQRLIAIDDGTANETHQLSIVASTGVYNSTTVDGGVTQANASTGNAVTAGTAFKAATSIKVNDLAAGLNNGTLATDASITMPTVHTIRFGAGLSAAAPSTGEFHEFLILPTDLSDAQLGSLTTL